MGYTHIRQNIYAHVIMVESIPKSIHFKALTLLILHELCIMVWYSGNLIIHWIAANYL